MIWYVLIGYVIISQIIVIGLFCSTLFSRDSGTREQLAHLSPKSRMLSIGVAFFLGIALAPLVTPFLFYLYKQCSRTMNSENEYWESIQTTHHELTLVPLHESNLDEELLNHFETETPDVEAAGFNSMGEYWLKPEPFNSKARIFLQDDGHTMVEVGRVLEIEYIELLSFLDDGSVVSSATCEPIDIQKPLSKNGYHIQCCSELTTTELLESHEQFLNQTSDTKQIDIRCVPESQWSEYFQYHNRRFSQIKYLIGKANSPTEAIFPETGLTETHTEPATAGN